MSATPPAFLDNERVRFDPREYDLFQRTQVQLIKQYFVLQDAVRNPAIASLPILAPYDDPVFWLQENLEVEFLDGSELLSIRLHGKESQAQELKLLVEAVAKAYDREVVFAGKQRRLSIRDAKAKSWYQLKQEITGKLTRITELKKELKGESVDSVEVQVMQLDMDVLLQICREMQRSLELDDIEAEAPERIRYIPPVVVRPD